MNSVKPANNGAPGSRQTLNNTVQIHWANQPPPIVPPPSYGVTTQQYGVKQFSAQYGAQAPITTQPVAQPPPGEQVPYGTQQGQAQYGTQESVISHVQHSGSVSVIMPGSVMFQPEVRWLQVEQVPGCHPCISPLVALNSVILQDESGLFSSAAETNAHTQVFKLLTLDGFVIYTGTKEHISGSFKCSMTDQGGKEVVRVRATFACGGTFECCKSNINIEFPSGNSLGQMKQACHVFETGFYLQFHDGPAIEFSIFRDGLSVTIKITQAGQTIGNIQGPSLSPSSPNVHINFFGEVDVKVKAGIIGAAPFLSGRYMYFTVPKTPQQGHGRLELQKHTHGYRHRRGRRR